MSVPITAQEFWDANTPPRINQPMVQSTTTVDRSQSLVARPDGVIEDMPNNEPLKHHIHNIPIYVSSSIPLAKIAVLQDNKLLKRKACWNSLVGRNTSSERNVSLVGRQYVFLTVASMGENSVVNKTNPAGHQDSEIDASSQYEGNEANFLEIPMNDNAITEEVEEINLDNLIPGESLVGIPRMFISTDVPLKLDFFFYDIEDPTYHLAPKCNDRLLDCFRFIAQQNGTHIFCYCMSQGNGRFERLTQGHFGCGKIWMDIKRYLEQERWSIRYVALHGAECWIGLLHSRRKASRMFAKYFRRDGFLREHYILSHEYLFIHTPAWGRVRHCTESEYEPNDVKFFSDKATQIINGVTVEIGMLKFKMFDADVEDPAGILENKRFLLGKSVRTMKNKKNLSQGSRKKMIAAEEKFLEVEKRMADPNIIT